MAKNKAPRNKRPGMRVRRLKTAFAIVLALSMIAGWTMLAHSGALDSAFRPKTGKGQKVSPASLNSNSPSKELIYLGSRLLASEEPNSGCGSGPGTPGTLTATFNASTTAVDLSWPASTGSVDHYEVERRNGAGSYAVVKTVPPASGTVTTTDNNGIIADTAYLYRVRAFDSANCPSTYSVDLATTTIFTNDPLVAQVTTVQAVHLTQLRTAVNAVRATAGLTAFNWSDAPSTETPAVGGLIRKEQMQKLREKLNDALTALDLSTLPNDPTLALGSPVKATHVQDVRNKVK